MVHAEHRLKPALGDAGFTMMAIAALLATSSSVNATLYASGGLTAMLAQVGQFPTFNVADSCISVGAVLLFIASWQKDREPRAAPAPGAA